MTMTTHPPTPRPGVRQGPPATATTTTSTTTRLVLLSGLLAGLLGGAAPAGADERALLPARVPGSYHQECASCHTAYPPRLLPAASWQRLMGDLRHHYGTDTSLDPDTVRQLAGWLQANAAGGWRTPVAPPEDRITRSAWFERKHRHIDTAVWALPSVKSAANCAACHPGADRGDYDDDSLRFPAGLDPRQRRAWRDD